MALVNMGRFDEAYDLIKFWMKEPSVEVLAEMINDLAPGKWLRLLNQDKKENLFDVMDKSQIMKTANGPFLPALVAIKLHVISKSVLKALRQQKKQLGYYVSALEEMGYGYIVVKHRPYVVETMSWDS